MKKFVRFFLVFSLLVSLVMSMCSCGGSTTKSNKNVNEVYIYNFGEYLSEEAIEIFEKETGITIRQDVFEANEEVLPVIENGAQYDVICISDYMIEKMGGKGLLKELDKSKIPNLVNINKEKLEMLSVCDPNNKYAVPYFCGLMGIMYNKDRFDEIGIKYPTKWDDLWNPALKGELLMQSSIRDLYAIGLIKNGFSPNSTNKEEIDIVTEDFITQKPIVQAYMCDLIGDKMLSGEASVALIPSGDVQYVYLEGGDANYGFVVPEAGTQFFIDSWCVLDNAKNVENAYKFIDYMCREDVARANADFIGYESVNDTVRDEEYIQAKIHNAYYDYSPKENKILGRDVQDAMRYYTDGYNKIKAS